MSVATVNILFRRSDVARLRPDPSAAVRFNPHLHLLKNDGQNFLGWHVTLHVWAVRETIFLKEPTRAVLALFVPMRALVKLLARKISSPCFISEHADFTVGEGIFYQRMFLAVSLAFLLVAFVIIILFAFAPPILYLRSMYLLEPSLRKLWGGSC